MPIVEDKGNWRNRLNSKLADIIANVLGQKMNYTIRYYSHRHRMPNFKHPKDLSERILSAMLSKDFLKYADYADKVKVREYIKAKGFEDILLEQYGAWEDANQIPFNQLPERFILKANNGSGGHVICTDKSKLNIPETIEKMNATLKDANRLRKTEPHYCAIKPMILAEQLMGDGVHLPIDYKLFCIKGKVIMSFIGVDREIGAKFITVDNDWNLLPYMVQNRTKKEIPPKPRRFDDMLKIAETISKDFDFVRVDLYEYNSKIIFGELTFSPEGGIMSYFTNDAIIELGKKFDE